MKIKIQKKYAFDLPTLRFYVLKFIYEKKTMPRHEIWAMEDSLVNWSRKVPIEDVELEEIQSLGWMLQKNEEGAFDERKRLFKEKQVDWKKFHRLPGASTEKEIYLAKQAYREYAQKNPEQEGLIHGTES